MKYFVFLAGSLLLVGTAQAQAVFSLGPRVGFNAATAHFPDSYSGNSYTSRPGFEAGLTSTVQLGHFAIQPSLLFAQKGYNLTGSLQYIDSPPAGDDFNQQVRLNYVMVPLNLAFTLGHDGQGLQVYGGPYVSMLVGGNYAIQTHIRSYTTADVEHSGKVKPANEVSDADNLYSRRFDGGLQAGLGYRLGGWQLQAGYSLGLRNLAVQYQSASYSYQGPANYNRAWQASLSYLVGSKGKG